MRDSGGFTRHAAGTAIDQPCAGYLGGAADINDIRAGTLQSDDQKLGASWESESSPTGRATRTHPWGHVSILSGQKERPTSVTWAALLVFGCQRECRPGASGGTSPW